MTKLNKIFKKFFNNPQSLQFKEIERLLIACGCVKIAAKGSHVKFKHPLATADLIFPIHNGDCKDFYKKNALKFIINNKLTNENNNSALNHTQQ